MSHIKIDKEKLLEILLARDLDRGIATLQDIPPPSSLTHVFEGAKKVANCIKNGQEVLVVGDYDADGVCASAIMVRFFESLGYDNVRIVIPHRFDDGYGVSATLLEKYANNASIVVSVDNGINAICAGKWCKKMGIELIITDHHTPTGELPQADVIIDPYLPECTFPQKDICGSTVAWYFCAAIKQILNAKIDMKIFLEYLAIACIGDVMPLVGLNRILVKKGIERLKSVDSAFNKLVKAKIKNINAQSLAFYLVPLLNSAGRMADANLALKLLVSKNFAEANATYDNLLALNKERKIAQSKILESCKSHIIQSEHLVLSYGAGWHEGVLGIVASNLAKEYAKSAFVFSEHNGILKGSGRSFGGVNLIASITLIGDCLLRFGGHSGAVGLSLDLEKLHNFIERFEEMVVIEQIQNDDVLGIISSVDIDRELLEICQRFEPFGEENEIPIFICQNLLIESIKPLGTENKHFEYTLYDNENKIRLLAVEFFANEMREVGQCGDVYFSLLHDEFKNELKIKIQDFMLK